MGTKSDQLLMNSVNFSSRLLQQTPQKRLKKDPFDTDREVRNHRK